MLFCCFDFFSVRLMRLYGFDYYCDAKEFPCETIVCCHFVYALCSYAEVCVRDVNDVSRIQQQQIYKYSSHIIRSHPIKNLSFTLYFQCSARAWPQKWQIIHVNIFSMKTNQLYEISRESQIFLFCFGRIVFGMRQIWFVWVGLTEKHVLARTSYNVHTYLLVHRDH